MTATAKLFMNGRSQAVRLPAEFRFEGTEVDIRRDPLTGAVILSQRPQRSGSWEAFFKARDEVPPEDLEGFLDNRGQGMHERDDPFA